MNAQEVIDRFRWELRHLAWTGEHLEQTPSVTRRTRANGIEVSCYEVHDLEETIRQETENARKKGSNLEWKAFSFDPPSLLTDLESAGFSIGPQEAIVVYDLSAGLDVFEVCSKPDVRRVDQLEMLTDFRTACEAAFDKDYSYTTNQLAEMVRSGRTGHDGYVAYADGVPAAAGRLYTSSESHFAGLYGGGTVPAYRGRGLYRAVVGARAEDAHAAGAKYLQVDALPTSLPILLRLGFVHIADTWPCEYAGR